MATLRSVRYPHGVANACFLFGWTGGEIAPGVSRRACAWVVLSATEYFSARCPLSRRAGRRETLSKGKAHIPDKSIGINPSLIKHFSRWAGFLPLRRKLPLDAFRFALCWTPRICTPSLSFFASQKICQRPVQWRWYPEASRGMIISPFRTMLAAPHANTVGG